MLTCVLPLETKQQYLLLWRGNDHHHHPHYYPNNNDFRGWIVRVGIEHLLSPEITFLCNRIMKSSPVPHLIVVKVLLWEFGFSDAHVHPPEWHFGRMWSPAKDVDQPTKCFVAANAEWPRTSDMLWLRGTNKDLALIHRYKGNIRPSVCLNNVS